MKSSLPYIIAAAAGALAAAAICLAIAKGVNTHMTQPQDAPAAVSMSESMESAEDAKATVLDRNGNVLSLVRPMGRYYPYGELALPLLARICAETENDRLELTLDASVQYFVEEELSSPAFDYGVTGLVMDIHTGEILAWCALGGSAENAGNADKLLDIEFSPGGMQEVIRMAVNEQNAGLGTAAQRREFAAAVKKFGLNSADNGITRTGIIPWSAAAASAITGYIIRPKLCTAADENVSGNAAENRAVSTPGLGIFSSVACSAAAGELRMGTVAAKDADDRGKMLYINDITGYTIADKVRLHADMVTAFAPADDPEIVITVVGLSVSKESAAVDAVSHIYGRVLPYLGISSN